MSEQLSAAAFIKRFREAKPTSREERIKQDTIAGRKNLWYEGGKDENEKPRSQPVPTAQSVKPKPTSSILNSVRKPSDYVTNSRASDASLDIDNIFKRNIQDEYSKHLHTDRDLDVQQHSSSSARFSFDLDRSNDRFDFGRPRSRTPSPTYRFRVGGVGGGGRESRFGGGSRDMSASPSRSRDFGRDYNISPFHSRDFGRASVETLGSTGFRGLLDPDLKLDGRRGRAAASEEEEKTVQSKATEGIKDIHTDMAQLMKTMAENQQQFGGAGGIGQGYFPDGVAHTIPQVAIKLAADMLEFKSHFPEHAEEDRLAAEQKKRDAEMVEKGRQEQREKQLMDDSDYIGGEQYYNQQHYYPMSVEQQQHQYYLQRIAQQQRDVAILNEQYHLQQSTVRDALQMRNNDSPMHSRRIRYQSAAPSALQISTDSQKSQDGPESSPVFQLLDSDVSSNVREAFAVGGNTNDSTTAMGKGIASTQSPPHVDPVPFNARDELTAQQMRELLVRITERGGELLQKQQLDLDKRPQSASSSAAHRTVNTVRAAPITPITADMPPYSSPYGQPMYSHHHINPHAPPTYVQQLPHQRHYQQQGNIAAQGLHRPSQQYRVGLEDGVFDDQTWQAAPPPELKSFATAAKSIVSALRAMETTLNTRLPPDLSSMSLADRIRATMEKEKDAAEAVSATTASKTTGATPTSKVKMVKTDTSSATITYAAAAPNTPAPNVVQTTDTSNNSNSTPSSESKEQEKSNTTTADKGIAGQVAAGLVNSVLAKSTAATATASKTVAPSTSSAAPVATAAASDPTSSTDPAAAGDANKKIVNKNLFGLKPAVDATKTGIAASLSADAVKTSSQQLSELDAVLGIDNYRRVWGHSDLTAAARKPVTSLGLGQFVPPVSTAAAKDIMRSTTGAADVSKSSTATASQQLPLPWEVTTYHPQSVDLRTMHGLQQQHQSSPTPVLVQAPTDAQLLQRQQYHPTAPAAVQFHDQPHYVSAPTTVHYASPLAATNQSHNPLLAMPPVLRPVEGFAMQQLAIARQQQQEQQQQYQIQHQEQLSRAAATQQQSQFLSSQQHTFRTQNNDSVGYTPILPPTISPSASTREREIHLQRMKQMRLEFSSGSGSGVHSVMY